MTDVGGLVWPEADGEGLWSHVGRDLERNLAAIIEMAGRVSVGGTVDRERQTVQVAPCCAGHPDLQHKLGAGSNFGRRRLAQFDRSRMGVSCHHQARAHSVPTIMPA